MYRQTRFHSVSKLKAAIADQGVNLGKVPLYRIYKPRNQYFVIQLHHQRCAFLKIFNATFTARKTARILPHSAIGPENKAPS
ncbi:hypothetical protein V6N13_056684 [Hibiscus sabdariffa]